MKNKLIVVAVIMGILMILACGNTVDTTKAEKINNTNVDSKNTDAGKEDNKVFKINEEIKLDNTVLTVLSMEKSKGGEYDDKKQGMEYVIVTVKLKNTSKTERVSYDPFDFKLENSQKNLKDSTYLSTIEELETAELTAGGEVTGKIAFEEPINDPKLTLEYQPNMFDESVIRIALNY